MQGARGAMGAYGMGGLSAQERYGGHKASVEAFPAKTEGQGNQPLKPRIENGVKVFELTAQDILWETDAGREGRDGSVRYGRLVGAGEVRRAQGERRGVPREDRGQGQPAAEAADRERREGVRADCPGHPVGDGCRARGARWERTVWEACRRRRGTAGTRRASRRSPRRPRARATSR